MKPNTEADQQVKSAAQLERDRKIEEFTYLVASAVMTASLFVSVKGLWYHLGPKNPEDKACIQHFGDDFRSVGTRHIQVFDVPSRTMRLNVQHSCKSPDGQSLTWEESPYYYADTNGDNAYTQGEYAEMHQQ